VGTGIIHFSFEIFVGSSKSGNSNEFFAKNQNHEISIEIFADFQKVEISIEIFVKIRNCQFSIEIFANFRPRPDKVRTAGIRFTVLAGGDPFHACTELVQDSPSKSAPAVNNSRTATADGKPTQYIALIAHTN
jgi:hypothetical protein